jgi:hypothetical protein
MVFSLVHYLLLIYYYYIFQFVATLFINFLIYLLFEKTYDERIKIIRFDFNQAFIVIVYIFFI